MAGNSEAVRREVTSTFFRIFTNTCMMPRLLKRTMEKYFQEGVKIGASLDMKTAIRVVGADGQAFQPEGLVRTTIPLTVAYWNQEAFIYNDTEEAMYLDEDKRANYIKPHAVNLANKVDRYMLQYMQATVPNWVGTPGTVPSGATAGLVPTAYQSAQTKLDQLLAMQSDRYIVYNAQYNQQVIQAAQTIFNPQQIIGKMFLEGKVGRYAEFDFMKDEQVPSMTIGTYTGTPVVSGANQVGTSLLTSGWTGTTTLSQGPGVDRFTAAGCLEINLQSRLALPGILKQFAIITPVTDTSTTPTLNIFPAIIPSGPYQNCSASPTSGGSVTIAGTSATACQTAFAFQEDAFTWVSIPLQDVSDYGAKCYPIGDEETGLHMRCVQQWDNRMGEVTTRMDFVWGIAQTECDHKSLVIFG